MSKSLVVKITDQGQTYEFRCSCGKPEDAPCPALTEWRTKKDINATNEKYMKCPWFGK
ncbi:MAG: hypothetical protein FWC51_01980 [Proteobacteria bacterium]|nr:hypothetical protein [Pseudomonadota bacterium]